MKKGDYILVLCVAIVACVFAFVKQAGETFNTLTANSPVIMSFFKFAILATLGEMIEIGRAHV